MKIINISAFFANKKGRLEEIGYEKFINGFQCLSDQLELLNKDSITRYKNIKKLSTINDICGFMSIFSALMPVIFTFFNNQALTIVFSLITVILTSFTTFFQPQKRLEKIITLRDFSGSLNLRVKRWKVQIYDRDCDISEKEKILDNFLHDLEKILTLTSEIDKH